MERVIFLASMESCAHARGRWRSRLQSSANTKVGLSALRRTCAIFRRWSSRPPPPLGPPFEGCWCAFLTRVGLGKVDCLEEVYD